MIEDTFSKIVADAGIGPVDVRTEALTACDAGMSVLRVAGDGSKAPKGSWKKYQRQRANRAEVERWFAADSTTGVGVVCGVVSGGLEMFEFEGVAVSDGLLGMFEEAVADAGLGELWDRVTFGWKETTPSGGIHVYYRWRPDDPDAGQPGNAKLAMRVEDDGEVVTLIETRAEGGFSVIAPSHGTVHDSGKPWERVHGGPATVATITATEHAALFEVARSFDERGPGGSATVAEPVETPEGLRVESKVTGDGWIDGVVAELNRRSWRDVLGAYGWTHVGTDKGVDYWRRPGKDNGSSATTNGKGTDRLIVFSSSTPFESYTGVGNAPSFDRLDVIATYSHGGDRVAAARALDPNAPEEYKRRKIEEERRRWEEHKAEVRERVDPRRSSRSDPKIADPAGEDDPGADPPAGGNGSGNGASDADLGERPEVDPRPVIVTNDRELRDVRDDMLDAVRRRNATAPRLFVRGGQVVEISADEHGRRLIVPVSERSFANAATDAAVFVRQTFSERSGLNQSRVGPPRDVTTAVLALTPDQLQLPALAGLADTPIVRPDGTICTEAGYDPVTRLVYHPGNLHLPAIPGDPSFEDVERARELLVDLVADFPFTDESSRANAVGLILTAVLRPAITGNVPLAVVSATTPGTGKSLLVSIVGVIATGQPTASIPWPGDEEEARKSLTANLLDGSSIVALDNIEGALRSPRLASAITAGRWRDRLLGVSKTVEIPAQTTWIANGNGVALRGDLPRRAYWIRMDPATARPWTRTGWRHPDLLEYATKHRGELVAAVLTMARAWFNAGAPAPAGTPLGSFERWTTVIGGVLELAGVEGFLANAEDEWNTGDPEGDEWIEFLDQLRTALPAVGFTAGGVAKEIAAAPEKWSDYLPAGIVGDVGRPVLVRTIGNAFSARAGRRWDDRGLRVVNAGTTRTKVAWWRVVVDHE